ncbi:MAG: MFS transporter, partial [Deltaproteobacteria bacterium]|nr:MFS transporter [Deltaproteobacteria bacterium]
MYFLTDVAKMAPHKAGLIIALATVWDAIAGLTIGIVSDRSNLKSGRRRPFLIGAAIPFGVSFWLLFTDFGLGSSGRFIYYLVMVIFYWAFFGCQNIPYTALAGEMTQDYDDRMSLTSYRMGWGQVFGIAAASFPLILAGFYSDLFGSLRAGWSVMAATFGFFAVFPILYTWFATKGYELYPEKSEFQFKEMVKAVFSNRPFRYTLGVWTGSVISVTLTGTVGIYFMTYIMGFDENRSSMVYFFMMTLGIVFVPLINIVSLKIGKRWAFIVFEISYVASLCGLLWVGPSTEIWYWVLIAIFSGGGVLCYLMGWSMIPDVVEVDELKTGQRREAMFFSMAAFIQKFGCGIALWLNGLVLSRVGYVPDVAQTPDVLFAIKMLFCVVPGILGIIAIIFAYLLPLTREKHEALCDIICRQKEGLACDYTSVEDVI